MVAAAVIGGAVIGAGASIYSGNKAANAQEHASDAANAEARYEFDQNQQRMAPWLNTGKQALGSLAYGMGLDNSQPGAGGAPLSYDAWLQSTSGAPAGASGASGGTPAPLRIPQFIEMPDGRRVPVPPSQQQGAQGALAPPAAGSPADLKARAAYAAYLKNFKPTPGTAGANGFGDLNRDFTLADFNKDPGYQFRMDEGTQALERSAAARGGLLSGGTLKDLTNYSQGVASGEYSNAYNRFNADRTQRFNRLSALAGTGQTAATNLNSDATNLGNTVGNNILGAANARSAGYVNTGNAINSGINTIGNYYLQQQYLNRFAPQSTITAPGALPASANNPVNV